MGHKKLNVEVIYVQLWAILGFLSMTCGFLALVDSVETLIFWILLDCYSIVDFDAWLPTGDFQLFRSCNFEFVFGYSTLFLEFVFGYSTLFLEFVFLYLTLFLDFVFGYLTLFLKFVFAYSTLFLEFVFVYSTLFLEFLFRYFTFS